MSEKTLNQTKQALNCSQRNADQVVEDNHWVNALMTLHFKRLELEGQLARERFQLMAKYNHIYRSIDERRRQIIVGDVEPTDSDCDLSAIKSAYSSTADTGGQGSPQMAGPVVDIKGIPGFWLKALQTVNEISIWIEPQDDEPLFHLMDIGVEIIAADESPVVKIVLNFQFETNDFFANKTLTKSCELGFGPNPRPTEDNGNHFDDYYYPIRRTGCRIDWKTGRNITKQLIRDENGDKFMEKVNSFFDIFDDSQLKSPSNGAKNRDEINAFLSMDWYLFETLFKRFVPNAVLFYTNDAFVSEMKSDFTESSDYSTDGSDQ